MQKTTHYLALELGAYWHYRAERPLRSIASLTPPNRVPEAANAAINLVAAIQAPIKVKTVITYQDTGESQSSSLDDALQTVKKNVQGCQQCSLGRLHHSRVTGTGVSQPTWLFVGDSPRYFDALAEEAFLGHSGQLLDQALNTLKISRTTNAYFTNAVKCRAFEGNDDRAPLSNELKACNEYLQQQIEALQPKIIVALGLSALISLRPDLESANFNSSDQEILEYNQIPLIATLHPEDLIGHPYKKKGFWQTLCRAQLHLESRQQVK